MTTTMIEQIKDDIIIQQLKTKNLNNLNDTISSNNINLKESNKYGYNDLLYIAIENDDPKDVIEYILKECEYEKVNYTINSNSTTPLGLAIARNNFEVADLLCDKYNADINYGEGITRCLPFVYNYDTIKPKQIDFLFKRGYNFYDLPNNIIKKMVVSFQNNLLKRIWKHCIFSNQFIIQILEIRKDKKTYITTEWEKIIREEKQKLKISDDVYETAFEHKNWEALQLFLNNDGRSQKITIFDMIEEYEAIEQAIDNQDINMIKAISNFGYALNYKSFNFEDLILKSYRKGCKKIWKALIKTSLLSYKEKATRLIEGFDDNLRKNVLQNIKAITEQLPNTDQTNKDMNKNQNITKEPYILINENIEENDITNNVIIKNYDGINYNIKKKPSQKATTKNNLNNKKIIREKSFIANDDLSRDLCEELIMDDISIISPNFGNVLNDSSFINETNQGFTDDNSKLKSSKTNPNSKMENILLEIPRNNSDSTLSNPILK